MDREEIEIWIHGPLRAMPSHFCLVLLHLAHSSHLINDYWVNKAINDALLWRAIVSYIIRIFIQGIVCKQDMCKNIRISHLTRCDLLQWAMLLNHQLMTNDLKLRDQRCPPEDAGATASNHPPTALLQKAAQLGGLLKTTGGLLKTSCGCTLCLDFCAGKGTSSCVG